MAANSMAIAASLVTSTGGFERGVRTASGSCEARWYAAYTNANHEKRVAEQLGVREVEHFLPTYSSVRRWKHRRVTLELPLFPGYVFVRMALQNRLQVLHIPGVARLVGFDGTPAALPDEEIKALRAGFASGVRAEPHPYLKIGRRVQVKSGPLAGLHGILKRRKSQSRLVLSVELIQKAMAVEIDEADIETGVLPDITKEVNHVSRVLVTEKM